MRRRVFLVALVAVILIGLTVCGSGYAGPLQPNATFTGGVAFSADGVRGDIGGNLRVDTIAANVLASPNTQNITVQAAYLYNVTFGSSGPATTQATLGTTMVTLDQLTFADPACCNLQTYRANVTSIVAPLVNGKPGLTLVSVSPISRLPDSDGYALVVVFSSPSLDPRQSVAILDGGQSGPVVETTAFGLGSPLDKTIPGFNAVLSLGIQFSDQDVIGHACGQNPSFPQFSIVDVNGRRLTSCAGGADDGQLINGALITVGGVGDSTDLPADPFCEAGQVPKCTTTDDELYGISSFLNQGDTQVKIATSNPTNDDSIFLGILQLTAFVKQVCQVDCGSGPPPQVPGPPTLLLLGTALVGLIGMSRLLRIGLASWICSASGGQEPLGRKKSVRSRLAWRPHRRK